MDRYIDCREVSQYGRYFVDRAGKPLIRGLLNELGRGHELRRFFRDMQVQESRAPGQAHEEPAERPDEGRTTCRATARTAPPATMTSRSERPGAPGD